MNADAAFHRIDRSMLALGIIGFVIVLPWLGWRSALAFALGATVSGLNFRWLKGGVDLLAARFASQPDPQPVRRVAIKMILRYALIGVVCYGIFKYLRVSLWAFCGGLFVAVASVMAEIMYELTAGKKNA